MLGPPGLKCLGELNRNELGGIVKDMVDTAQDFIYENNVIENCWSRFELPP